jgi:glycyl-tRNA synthetase beta chain
VEGAVLSIGDKAETVAGMFALGLQPTGSKDPFALRRQANGIVRTIAEHKLPIGIGHLFELARETYRDSPAEKKFAREFKYEDAVRAFFRERLEFYLRDHLGYKYDVVNAVLAVGADDVVDTVARAEAVSKVRGSADFDSISVAFKRIKNILRQANEAGKRIGSAVDSGGFREGAERKLGLQIPEIAQRVDRFRKGQDYSSALAETSKIRPAVDAFFDKVMVMVEDDELRANRLALLQAMLKEFSTIADFSEIVTEGK